MKIPRQVNYPIPCLVVIKPEAKLFCFAGLQADVNGNYSVRCGMEKNKRIYTKRTATQAAESVADSCIVSISFL